MSTDPTGTPSVLYVGLRRPELEWATEIDAAISRGFDVRVASDGKLGHTGLPSDARLSFTHGRPLPDTVAEIVTAVGDDEPAAVLCWGDRYVRVTAELADHWGLRGVTPAAAAVCTDKVAQRRALEPQGLNPRWRAGETVDEFRAAVADLGTPLVFKLAHCSAGRGTTVVTETTDLDAVFKQTTLNYVDSDAFLVEDVVDGTEHSVSGVVVNGAVRVLGVSDKLLVDDSFETWCTIVPSARVPVDVARIEQAATAAVRAVGIRSGGFHVDLRFTTGGPIVLEVGARLGGDTINSHLIPLASKGKVRPYDAMIAALTTGELRASANFPAAAAMLVLPTAHRSPVEAVERALEHAAVQFAEEWPTEDTIAIGVVVSVDDPATIHVVIDDVRGWLG
jgi:formate-dependent phosphoribosylglycinamide formyltransferase (GAR transformylase)